MSYSACVETPTAKSIHQSNTCFPGLLRNPQVALRWQVRFARNSQLTLEEHDRIKT